MVHETVDPLTYIRRATRSLGRRVRCFCVRVLVDAIERSEELLEDERHVLARHLEADPETDDVERVDELVTDDGARPTARRETRVSGRDDLEYRKDNVFKDGLLE